VRSKQTKTVPGVEAGAEWKASPGKMISSWKAVTPRGVPIQRKNND